MQGGKDEIHKIGLRVEILTKLVLMKMKDSLCLQLLKFFSLSYNFILNVVWVGLSRVSFISEMLQNLRKPHEANFSRFHQYLPTSFCVDILSTKNNKAKVKEKSFEKHFCAKKLLIKCWWNWHHEFEFNTTGFNYFSMLMYHIIPIDQNIKVYKFVYKLSRMLHSVSWI